MINKNIELMRLITGGPVVEIFRAEQSLSLLNVIGLLANEINASNYGEVFGTVQSLSIDRLILSITKLYEVPNRYPLKSIPGILKYFDENSENLEITEPYLLNDQLRRLGLFMECFEDFDKNKKNIFVHYKMNYLLSKINQDEAIKSLKIHRDKKIAHPKDTLVESLPKISWVSIEGLLSAAKNIVGIIGDGYLSSSFMIDSDYLLSNDATRVGRGLARILSDLGINTSEKSERSRT